MKKFAFLGLLLLPVIVFSQYQEFKFLEDPVIDSFPEVKVRFNLRDPGIKTEQQIVLKEDSILEFDLRHLNNAEIPDLKNVLIIVENLRFQNRNQFYKNVLEHSLTSIVNANDNVNIATFDRVHNNDNQDILFFENAAYSGNYEQLAEAAGEIADMPPRSGYNNTYSYNQKNVNVESSDLYYAIYSGLQKLSADFPGGNNFLVILSTGFNNKNSSHVSTQTAMDYARENNIPVYSIQHRIQGYEGHRLTELVQQSYGQEEITSDYNEAATALINFMDEASERRSGNNYEITYNSSYPKDGKLHRAKIFVDNKEYTFDYYTPKESFAQHLWNNYRYLTIGGFFVLVILIILIVVLIIRGNNRKRQEKQTLIESLNANNAKLFQHQREVDRIKNAEKEKKNREERKKNELKLLAEMKSKGSLPQLIYRNNGTSGDYQMEKPLIKIGRSDSNDFVLNSQSVSRSHAELYYSGGEYFIKDLKSTSGTLKNGKKIQSEILKNGDVLNIGGVEVYFKL